MDSKRNSFLKTVSAYSNYDGGDILFGVNDQGQVKGLDNLEQVCLDIENKINDSISPHPEYSLEILNSYKIVKLTVRSGLNKPYCSSLYLEK